MDVINRQFEEYLLEEVESGAVWPISDEYIQTHTSPLLAIIHNGSDGRFDGSSSISFWCRRTRRVVTLVETVPTWHLEDEFDMEPSDLMKRMAVRILRELAWGMSTRQTISPVLAIQAQSEYPLPNSQETVVDSMSDYVLISPEDSPGDFEDIAYDRDENSSGTWDESAYQCLCESISDEGDSYIQLPFPSDPAPCARYIGHYVKHNGVDGVLGGHPSITYHCIRTSRTATLAVPRSWNWATTTFPERVVQGAIMLLFREIGDPGEIEAILDEPLLARAQEWANTRFDGNIEIEEEQAM